MNDENTAGSKKSLISLLKIEDRDSCIKAIEAGAIAAIFSTLFTIVIIFVGFLDGSDNQTINYIADPMNLIDVLIVIILAIFVYRKSRIASTLMLVYFIISKAITLFELGKPPGIVAIMFLILYITSMRATYIWHEKYANQTNDKDAEQDAS